MNRNVAIAMMVLFFSVSAGNVYCEQSVAGEGTTGTLRLIETYKAPPYPKEELKEKPSDSLEYMLSIFGKRDMETYDYRKNIAGVTVPPTLTDTLISDLWQRITKDLKLSGVTPKTVSEGQVVQAINIYLQRGWRDIAGYRPWTHWNFIGSLTPEQRDRLGKEVVAYMHDSGVKEGN